MSVFPEVLNGFTTTAIEMPIAATIKTKKIGSSEIKFSPIGSTGTAVGPAKSGEEVELRFGDGVV